MAGITGQGQTFNLPNYVGDLFELTPSDTPFLSLIGGLSGGEATSSPSFQWQAYDLRAAAVDNAALEGADAPTSESRVRANYYNVCQIMQESIEVSYSKMAAIGAYSGENIAGENPVTNEMDFQVEQMLKQIARDAEKSFLEGAFNDPTDNTTARKTLGIANAAGNSADMADAALTEDKVLDLMQAVWENGGIQVSETATLMCNANVKRQLTKIFVTDKNYREESRNVAGVNVTTIETDFGKVNVLLNRHVNTQQLYVVSAELCAPVFMNIPDKGFLFVEPLSKGGASEKFQIYGEVGLKYGNPNAHGKIVNIAAI
jgi:hypothetical protein